MMLTENYLHINLIEGVINMYNRILLAVDGSEHSMRAANEVVKLASGGLILCRKWY